MLEQLTVVDEATGGVSEQCSPNRMPFLKEDNNSDIHIQEDNTVEENKKIGIYTITNTFFIQGKNFLIPDHSNSSKGVWKFSMGSLSLPPISFNLGPMYAFLLFRTKEAILAGHSPKIN